MGGPDTAAGFIARLRDFHLECGEPSYQTLVDISEQLPDLYPDLLQWRDLPTLSRSTISDVLNRKRVNLPSAAWVVVFVLSCQRRALETCVLMDDPGLSVLPKWVELWQQARVAERS
ncbi:hypothetical protein SAMN04489712_103381 [Thermomonospora echinospora]|uniref:Uncharacterized protein n=1 Tax=Thermomonospora echinospora TaxID=1992 RepID=A0A1H5XSF2_9ACTN|nr:hypothetical protein SAMN04489712_103381 [Thermomonospora echinospora]